MDEHPHALVAIVPCNDIGVSTAFYERLGLNLLSDYGSYRILGDGKGWLLHLSAESPKGWVVPGRNPNGLYLYTADVDAIAGLSRHLEPACFDQHGAQPLPRRRFVVDNDHAQTHVCAE